MLSINITSYEIKLYAVIALIVILGSATHWAYYYPDSICYTETLRYMFSQGQMNRSVCVEQHISRPVTLFLAGAITPLFGIYNSFAIVNTIFWFLGAVFLHKFALQFFKSEKLAFYSSVLFATSIPLLRYGAALLTDCGGYFFTILSAYMVLKFRDNTSLKRMVLLAFIFAAGILTKNHLGFFVPMYLILSTFSERKVFYRSILTLFISLMFVMGVYAFFNADTFNLYTGAAGRGYTYDNPETWGIERFVLSFGGFLYLPFFTILGFLADKKKDRIMNYYYMLASFLPLFAWPAIEYRITFIMFPLIIPLATLGIENFSSVLCKKPLFNKLKQKHYEILIIALYIILSFAYVALYHSSEKYTRYLT